MRSRLGDRRDGPGSVDRLQAMKFGPEHFIAGNGDGSLGHFKTQENASHEDARGVKSTVGGNAEPEAARAPPHKIHFYIST